MPYLTNFLPVFRQKAHYIRQGWGRYESIYVIGYQKWSNFLPVFRGKDLDDIGLMPGIDFSVKKNCESSLEKVVSMHRIGCLSVGRGFSGEPEESVHLSPT